MADERRPETPAEADGTTGLFTTVGKLLKLLRERAGLTQKELGEAVGYGPDAIGAMERGCGWLGRRCWRRRMNFLMRGGAVEGDDP